MKSLLTVRDSFSAADIMFHTQVIITGNGHDLVDALTILQVGIREDQRLLEGEFVDGVTDAAIYNPIHMYEEGWDDNEVVEKTSGILHTVEDDDSRFQYRILDSGEAVCEVTSVIYDSEANLLTAELLYAWSLVRSLDDRLKSANEWDSIQEAELKSIYHSIANATKTVVPSTFMSLAEWSSCLFWLESYINQTEAQPEPATWLMYRVNDCSEDPTFDCDKACARCTHNLLRNAEKSQWAGVSATKLGQLSDTCQHCHDNPFPIPF